MSRTVEDVRTEIKVLDNVYIPEIPEYIRNT